MPVSGAGEWVLPVSVVAEIASGVLAAWARRDGVGVVVAAASALPVLAALVSMDVAALPSTVSAAAFVLAVSLALPVALFEVSACICCSAVAWGCIASAMAAMGIVELTTDVHAIAQSR